MKRKEIVIAVLVGFLLQGGALANDQLEVCREKLKKAQTLDLLHDLEWPKGKSPRVVVGPTFFSIPFDAKEGFAQTVNCFLAAGKQDQCINFDLTHWRTGNPAARWSWCKLKVF